LCNVTEKKKQQVTAVNAMAGFFIVITQTCNPHQTQVHFYYTFLNRPSKAVFYFKKNEILTNLWQKKYFSKCATKSVANFLITKKLPQLF
jgi:hypothetical protein